MKTLNKELTCCIPIEIVAREFNSRLLIALDLVEKGIPCLIGSHLALLSAMKNFVPFIYLEKSTNISELPIYRMIYSQGGSLAVLDEEGGVLDINKTSLLARNSEETLALSDFVFTWGHEQRKFLLEKRKNALVEKIIVVGNPRFDLRKTKYNLLYKDDAANYITRYGKYILVNTSFGSATHSLGTEEGKNIAKNVVFHKNDYLEARQAYYTLIFYYFVKAISRLAHEFPNTNIIVRPHPSEDSMQYINHLNGHKNVHIIQQGEAFGWILGAGLVIHHDCTTGIEAAIASKKTLSYAPIEDGNFAPVLPMIVSHKVKTLEALVDIVRFTINQGESEQCEDLKGEKKKYLESFIANIDFEASPLIASSIEQNKAMIINNIEKRFDRKAFENTKNFIPQVPLDQRLRHWMQLLLSGSVMYSVSLKRRKKLYKMRKFPGISSANINHAISIHSKIDPRYRGIKAKEICPNLFKITR